MLHMELANDTRLVYETARYLSELAPGFGVPQDKTGALCFLLETALSLRMENLKGADATLLVDVGEKDCNFVVSLTDKGLPYVPTHKQRKVFNNAKLGQMAFEQLGAEGQRLSFRVFQSPGYVMPERPEPVEERLEDREVLCRRTTTDPEVIIEAIRCLYEVYGFSYIHQNLYHNDQFRALLESGRYVSVLAENAHGQVLGHAALEEHEWFRGLREVCNLVVKPMARGLGLAGKLCDYLIDLAVGEGTHNIYGLPVLHHPVSQKLLNRAGFVPCGLCANLMDMRDIQGYENEKGRASTAVCVRIVAQADVPALYLPAECDEFVCNVLEQMDFSWTRGDGSLGEPGKTALSYVVDSVHSNVEVKIDGVGPDLYETLDELYEQRGGASYKVITIYVNARDPRCSECYEYLRERGFVFSGCLPGGLDGDYLLLQQYNGCEFNRRDAVTEPNYDRMLEQLELINA